MAAEPNAKARTKRSNGRLRLVIISITMIDPGEVDFDAVTSTPSNA